MSKVANAVSGSAPKQVIVPFMRGEHGTVWIIAFEPSRNDSVKIFQVFVSQQYKLFV